MSVIIHAADLHISRAEEAYSLSVLDELVEIAAREKAAALLFAGDLFDTPADLEALRPALRRCLERLPEDTAVVYLPGNHEAADPRGLSARDFGRARVPTAAPFELMVFQDFDLVCIAQRPSYADYLSWQLPARTRPLRLALAHGTVAGLSFAGLAEEEQESTVIDPDLFERLEADYAALGHIHSSRQAKPGRCLLAYPGSARVWRVKQQECGPRGVLKLTLGAPLKVETLRLANAGELRLIELAVSPEGAIEGLDEALAACTVRDHVVLKLTGMVENERVLDERIQAVRRGLEGRLRRLDIDRDAIVVVEGIAELPLVKAFLKAWRLKQAEPAGEEERRIWLEARRLGLDALIEAAGKKK